MGEKQKSNPLLAIGGVTFCGLLILAGIRWPELLITRNPFVEIGKLITAAAIGIIVTSTHRQAAAGKSMTRSAEHAAILLCIAGALMMIIIGDSLARALGIAGGASIIRFRTPIKDPKDALIFLLLLGLGMASGLGNFAVAGLGTLFLSLFLIALTPEQRTKRRRMVLNMVAANPEFPTSAVQTVLLQHNVDYELVQVNQSKDSTLVYEVKLNPGVSTEELSRGLMGSGLKSVSWEKTK